jgi:hypothetical protein
MSAHPPGQQREELFKKGVKKIQKRVAVLENF